MSEDPEVQELWFDVGFLDDQLWHQALMMFHWLELMRGGDFPIDDLALFHLIRRGVVNHDDDDTLGARGGVPSGYTARTSQGNGQSTHQKPTRYITNTSRIFQANFIAVFPVQ